MKTTTWLPIFVAALLAGCANDPRVTTTWAGRARDVCSKDTPREETWKPKADYGPEDDRDRARLVSLDGEEDLGDVVVELNEGLYELDAFARLDGATSILIRGMGAHKTRIEVDTDTSLGLVLGNCPRVKLEGFTLVGLSGGGIGVQGGEVEVTDCVFAGASCGLALDDGAVARVSSSVFAGCRIGVDLNGSASLIAREVAFDSCFDAIKGRGALDIAACAFFDGAHDAIKAPVVSASIQSTLFAGEHQLLGFEVRPRVARALLVPVGFIRTQQDRQDFREIAFVEDFPDALRAGTPPGFDVAAVHLAIERARTRGERDAPKCLRDLAEAQAKSHAEAARTAMTARDLEHARREAAIALAYWRGYPLADGPEVLTEVAGLVQ